jgi:transcriptional regulator with XRE-family HTH domain
MAKKPKKPPALRWRVTLIRHWRNHRRMTLEGAADALGKAPYRLKTTHNSVGRLEKGLQMPKIELIEALANLYETDIDSMLNRLPTVPVKERPDAAELAALWDEASTEDREKIVAIATTIVRGTRTK